MSDPSLTEFYERGYSVEDPARAEFLGRWRALGAESKAAHVVELCRRGGLRPGSVVEIGCGDGSLLAALSARGLAGSYEGVELSGPAARIAAARAIPGVRRVEAYDGAHVPAADAAYDLAVVSHVLEHVPDPPSLLAEAARVASWVVVEVPLEDNRSARRPKKVAEARSIGHIQSYSRAAMHALFSVAGLSVVAELTDPLSRRHHAFFAGDRRAQSLATAKWALRAAVWRAAPLTVERLFTVHYAALLAPPHALRSRKREPTA
jgi:SAM-dependent methyltransferase